MRPHLRIARPTDRLEELATMYQRGLELTRMGSFEDHDGFDGVMLGAPGAEWHLEFTRERGAAAGGSPSPEHLLVLYYPDQRDWDTACERIVAAGFIDVPAHNPYWDERGRTYADLDGYRVVIQNAAWGES